LRDAIAGAKMPAPVAAALGAIGREAAPLPRLALMMPALAVWERRNPARSRIDDARTIISMIPLALARNAAGEKAGRADPADRGGIASRLLWGIHGASDEPDRQALDRVLIACAEHELNASTFAARVVASTGADRYASVLAALCSLSGPIHGGACDRIESMFADLENGLRLEELLAAFSGRNLLPPGFGHAIYPGGDPRAALLKKVAGGIARRRGRRLFEMALRVEEAVLKRDRLRPNLDFYLTVCTRMIGFPRGLPAAIFATGRAAGWIAHGIEQYADNRLIRPRMRYRGSPLRHWNAPAR
jgi:citrate synthase